MSTRYKIYALIIIFITSSMFYAFLTPIYAQANSQDGEMIISLNGYYKNLFIGHKSNEYYTHDYTRTEKMLLADVNRLRLSPNIDFGNNILFHADIDNEYIVSNYTLSPTFNMMWIGHSYNQLYTEYYDYSNDWYYRLKLHRAFVKVVFGKSTVTFGRQLVRFGSGKIWNPLDIVNPISPLAFEGAEETKGVDALRMELYPASFFEVGFVYVPQRKNDELNKESFSHSVYLLRNKAVLGDTEIAFLCGRIIERGVAGVDVSTVLYNGLLHASALGNKDRDTSYIIAGAGYEYSFESSINLLAEYFYNGNCLSENQDLQTAYYESMVYGMTQQRFKKLAYNFLTYNRHYASMSAGFSGASLFSARITSVVDFEGRGILLIPSVVYNILEDCDFTFYMVYAIITGNKSSDFSSFDNRPMIAGELKYYF